jgi:hypothetical protein
MKLFFIPSSSGGGGSIVDWQPNVIDLLTTPPGGPSVGDRYIVLSVGTGDWTGHENEIATWDGAAWTFEDPENGWATYAETPELIYIFNGSTWNAQSNEPEFRQSFVNGDLAGGVLTVTHSLGQRYHSVTVYDENGVKVSPDDITDVDLNNVTVDLSSFVALTGTWNVVVGG